VSEDQTRAEHLAWCKERALEYLDAGDLANAVASMGSDLNKHPQTGAGAALMSLGLMYVMNCDQAGVRRWIEGFN
jgi:Tfp pilus assembly protein PilF